ncbi:MAG TPA: hypothetical protein VKD65_06345, partial [Candidatus Angelobacter sp.]|nr:hypothetical protein [Candidatus Angelobacter sp.]
FLGLLIASELDAPYSPEEIAKSTERTKKWLAEEGWALAAKTGKETIPHSTTDESQHNAAPGDTEATSTEDEDESASEKIPRLGFMGLLQFRTGRSPSQIQDELKVPDFILTFAQDNPPEETPGGARKAIVNSAVKNGWVNEAEGEEALSRVLRKAAFRPTPYTHDKPGNEGTAGLRFKRYIELISNSKLKKPDKRYWLEFAKQEE